MAMSLKESHSFTAASCMPVILLLAHFTMRTSP